MRSSKRGKYLDDDGKMNRNSGVFRQGKYNGTRIYEDTIPRSREGIHPGRISSMRNVLTPTRSETLINVSVSQALNTTTGISKSTVRKTVLLVGVGRTKKRMLPAERRREYITGQIGLRK